MIFADYTTVENNFNEYYNKAANGETVVVTRKDNKDVVFISMDKFNQMKKKLISNVYYTQEELMAELGISQEEIDEMDDVDIE